MPRLVMNHDNAIITQHTANLMHAWQDSHSRIITWPFDHDRSQGVTQRITYFNPNARMEVAELIDREKAQGVWSVLK